MGDRSSSLFTSFPFIAADSGVFDSRNLTPDFLATAALFLANVGVLTDDPDINGSLSGVGFDNGGRVLEADFIAARGDIVVFACFEASSSSESLITRSRFR